MTENEKTLIDTIRSHDDHTEALLVAVEVIIEFLTAKQAGAESGTPQAS